MGSGIEIPFHITLTRENVYNAIITNTTRKIFHTQKGLLARLQSAKSALKDIGIGSVECIDWKRIEKQLKHEQQEILESYVLAFETNLPAEEIYALKAMFPGKNMMNFLSKGQQRRIKKAILSQKDILEKFTRACELSLSIGELLQCVAPLGGKPVIAYLSIGQRDRVFKALETNFWNANEKALVQKILKTGSVQ